MGRASFALFFVKKKRIKKILSISETSELAAKPKSVLFIYYLFISKFLSTYLHIQVHIHMRQGLGLG